MMGVYTGFQKAGPFYLSTTVSKWTDFNNFRFWESWRDFTLFIYPPHL